MNTIIPRAIYAILTKDSQSSLRLVLKELQYTKEYLHHVTIIYKPTKEEFNNLNSIIYDGQPVAIQLGRRFWSNGVEAVEARVLTEAGTVIPIKNSKPHITISTDGKPPVLSNDMLAGIGEFTDGFEGVQMIGKTYTGNISFIF